MQTIGINGKVAKIAPKNTIKNNAICIESPLNLHHISTCSDSNSCAFCVKLQRIMNGITRSSL